MLSKSKRRPTWRPVRGYDAIKTIHRLTSDTRMCTVATGSIGLIQPIRRYELRAACEPHGSVDSNLRSRSVAQTSPVFSHRSKIRSRSSLGKVPQFPLRLKDKLQY